MDFLPKNCYLSLSCSTYLVGEGLEARRHSLFTAAVSWAKKLAPEQRNKLKTKRKRGQKEREEMEQEIKAQDEYEEKEKLVTMKEME